MMETFFLPLYSENGLPLGGPRTQSILKERLPRIIRLCLTNGALDDKKSQYTSELRCDRNPVSIRVSTFFEPAAVKWDQRWTEGLKKVISRAQIAQGNRRFRSRWRTMPAGWCSL